MIGRTLSHFKITAMLGKGGMGEVYRAEDTTLDREVAIKVLPEAFTADKERLARFEREAKVLASLNHPNIAGIHELGSDGGLDFLAMELVEGEDLAKRLRKGPIPVGEALRLATQIATGLEAAHNSGVVHRDLKPANVQVTPEGQVKILDFGLAKKAVGGAGPPLDLSDSPTLTAQMTRAGTILGTAAYMSPEQARGQEVDAQTDIWALGVVLYEMLTGERTFGAETATDTIAAIIERQPDWEALPPATPPLVRSLLRRCLQKDRNRRLHDVADARLELEEVLSEAPAPVVAAEAITPAAESKRRTAVWSLASALLGLAIGLALATWMSRSEGVPTTLLSNAHLSIELAEETTLYMTTNPAIAISPDGRRLVWAAVHPDGSVQLHARGLDEVVARELEGTENARDPIFSPDGQWIAYFDHAETQLEKVPFEGGVPAKICDTPSSSKGATWGARGEIVFSRGFDGGLSRVAAEGGVPEVLTEPDRDAGVKTHRFPHFLPDGRALLFMVADHDMETYDEARIEALDLETGERKLLLEGGMSPKYVESGHLIFARQGSLMAVPFDPQALAIEGQPKEVFTSVVTNGGDAFGQFALTSAGTLVYAPGGPEHYNQRFVRADRSGHVVPLSVPERVYDRPSFALSPDGKRLAVTVAGANYSVWLWDVEREILSRLAAGGENQAPVWTPDGERLIFLSYGRGAGMHLMWIPADGSSQPKSLYETDRIPAPASISPDGQHFSFFQHDPETDDDIWVLPLDDQMQPGAPRKVVATKGRDVESEFSPDGRWLAYSSNETGSYEIYVQSFPGPGPRTQVSSEGGREPHWSPRGDAIYYVHSTSAQLMRAPVRTEPELRVGAPEPFIPFDSPERWYDIEPDGEHFIYIQMGSQAKPITQLRIVLNWANGLDRLFRPIR